MYDYGAIAERSAAGQRAVRDGIDPVTDHQKIENKCTIE
jgi:hypothetical protein